MSANVSNATGPIFGFALLGFLPCLTVFGNSLVVLAVLTDKSLKTPTHFLLLSLAIADLIVGIWVMPLSIYLVVSFEKF